VRWQILFLPQQIPLNKVWSVYMIGQMLNAVFPARAGDVGRIFLIGAEEETSRSAALSTVVMEKVIDLVMLTLAYLTLALWVATTKVGLPPWLRDVGRGLIPLTALALAGLLSLTYFGRSLWRFLRQGLRPFPSQWQAAADGVADRAITALEAFRHSRARTKVWGLSALIWVLMVLTNQLIFRAFGLGLAPYVAIALSVVLMSGAAAPPLPGNLGVFVYLCMLVLQLFGVNREVALVYGITLQVVVYLPVITLGLACMVWRNWSMRHRSAASH
jgi:uncharacterized protein (TIRG00374 family)